MLFEILAALSMRAEDTAHWVMPLCRHAAAAVESSGNSRTLAAALQMLYGAGMSTTGVLRPTKCLQLASTAVLQRSLHSDGTNSAAVRTAAGALLGVGWAPNISTAMHRSILAADMSWLVDAAEAAPVGSQAELWALRALMLLQVHPQMMKGRVAVLMRRLPAAIARCTDPANERLSFVLLMPLAVFLHNEEGLLKWLLDAGLLTAISRCIAAVSDVSYTAAATALQALTSKGYSAAVLAHVPQCKALASVAVDVCGYPSAAAFIKQLQHPKMKKGLEQLMDGILARVAKDAVRREAGKKLRRLHVCAFSGCRLVEDVGMQFKACGACVRRNSGGRDPFNLDNLASYRESRGAVAYYCSRECQVADRYAGHAHCLVDSFSDDGENAGHSL